MAHPLYTHATRLVGQPVYLHHRNGNVYHGTLISTTPQGVYVVQHPPGSRLASDSSEGVRAITALDDNHGSDMDLQLVYGPAAYFGFGALTGLTAAALFSPFWW